MSKKAVSLETKHRTLKLFASLAAIFMIAACPQTCVLLLWVASVCCFIRYAFSH